MPRHASSAVLAEIIDGVFWRLQSLHDWGIAGPAGTVLQMVRLGASISTCGLSCTPSAQLDDDADGGQELAALLFDEDPFQAAAAEAQGSSAQLMAAA